MRFCIIIFIIITLCNAKKLDSKHVNSITQSYETFFKEAFAQSYESFKVQKDSKNGLFYIDFCAYPPDRSLPFGALDNGRFKGEKINDLPFACDKSSGAKKYFIYNSTIQSSYMIIKTLPIASFLKDVPTNYSTEEINSNISITTLWQDDNKSSNIKRLWIIYRNNDLFQSCIIIFSQNGKNTEVILQYINMQ